MVCDGVSGADMVLVLQDGCMQDLFKRPRSDVKCKQGSEVQGVSVHPAYGCSRKCEMPLRGSYLVALFCLFLQ